MMAKLKRYALNCNLKLIKNTLTSTAIILYVLGQLVRYVFAFAKLPYWYLKTRKVIALRLLEMWLGKAIIPESIIDIDMDGRRANI